jgi:hypothetical protein
MTTAYPLSEMRPLQLVDPSPLSFQLHFPLSQTSNLDSLKLKKFRKPRKPSTIPKKPRKRKNKKVSKPKSKNLLESAIKSYLKKSNDLNEKRLNMKRTVITPSFIMKQKTQNRMQSESPPIIQEAVVDAYIETLKQGRERSRREAQERISDRAASGQPHRGRRPSQTPASPAVTRARVRGAGREESKNG